MLIMTTSGIEERLITFVPKLILIFFFYLNFFQSYYLTDFYYFCKNAKLIYQSTAKVDKREFVIDLLKNKLFKFRDMKSTHIKISN